MSGPENLRPELKFNPPGTDPIAKMAGSPTDPTSSLYKPQAPGTDPLSSLYKPQAPGTDPLSQVALNPQPLPPTNLQPGQSVGINPGPIQKGGINPGPIQTGGKDPGPISRGVRNTIIVVCLIALVLIGGGFVVESFQNTPHGSSNGHGHGGGNGSGTIQPGVYLREQQFQSSSGGAEGNTVAGKVSCNTTPSGGLIEHLIGGGVLADDSVAVRSSVPFGDAWRATFASSAKGYKETIVAICLREPLAFFTPSHTIDVVSSALDQLSNVNTTPSAHMVQATCPTGEHILGGGFSSTFSGSNGYALDALYPVSSGGADAWDVVYQLDNTSVQQVSMQSYAICSATMLTHLESTALPWNSETARGHASCASGTLLTGGYTFSFLKGSSPIPFIADDSAVDGVTHTPLNGYAVQNWFISAGLPLPGSYPAGALWTVCWNPATNATPSTGQPTSGPSATTTPAGQPTNTPKPRATATATPKPRPTNTPLPACQSLLNGSGTMNVDNTYLNVDVAAGIGHISSVAQVQFSPASGLLTPLNGAKLADKGTGGSGTYNGLTCAQLKSASYTATSVPATNGEVFLVKVANGHLAKVLVTVTPGNPFPSFTWQTYKP